MGPTSERWRIIEPRIREDLELSGIELIPRNLPEIFAKIHTGESLGGRGIFLVGGTGTGKTARLRWAAESFGIRMETATAIVSSMMEAEHYQDQKEMLSCIPPRWSVVPLHFNDLIIDDLGTEPNRQKVYGTDRDLMVDAIMMRYDAFSDPERQYKTHFTSNLSKDEIRKRYGERIWSRLNEMVTFVTLNGKDRRIG